MFRCLGVQVSRVLGVQGFATQKRWGPNSTLLLNLGLERATCAPPQVEGPKSPGKCLEGGEGGGGKGEGGGN